MNSKPVFVTCTCCKKTFEVWQKGKVPKKYVCIGCVKRT